VCLPLPQRRDAEKLLKKRRSGWDQTYSSLIADGDWRKLSLYTAKQWDKKLCKIAKFTCNLLREHMHAVRTVDLYSTRGPDAHAPFVSHAETTLLTWRSDPRLTDLPCDVVPFSGLSSLPGSSTPARPQDVVQIAGNQEEVVLFLTTPGSTVALHNGGTNTRLNVHIGLLNLNGSFIEVAGERREWSEKRSFVFDDGYDHTVVTPSDQTGKVEGPRVVLAVGISHPDLNMLDGEKMKVMTESERSNWQEGATNERIEL
jgi:hypothetical protein